MQIALFPGSISHTRRHREGVRTGHTAVVLNEKAIWLSQICDFCASVLWACPLYAVGVTPAGDAKTAPARKLAKNVRTVCLVDEDTVKTCPQGKGVHMAPQQ